jgi:hypothetical protein
VPADSDALARTPRGQPHANVVSHACNFVSGNAWILDPRRQTFLCEHIAVADATSLYLDRYLSRSRDGNLALDNLEVSALVLKSAPPSLRRPLGLLLAVTAGSVSIPQIYRSASPV